MRNRRNAGESVVDPAEKETTIAISNRGGEAHAVEGRKTCLIRAIGEPTHRVGFVEHLVAVDHHLATKLVGMVIPYPGQTGVGSGLAVNHMNLVAWTHARRHP